MRFVSKILLIIYCQTILLFAENSEYLISSAPKTLIIYDRYQHNIEESLPDLLHARAPLKIIEHQFLLSDQFTPVMKVEYDQKIWFVQINEQGEPLSADESISPDYKLFRNCIQLSDTVQILTNGRVALYDRPDFKEQLIMTLKGQILRLQLEFKNAYLVQTMGDKRLFGWIKKSARNNWQRIKTAEQNQKLILPAVLKNNIENEINEINQTYVQFFNFMNAKYSKSLSSPHWQISVSEREIQCRMSDSAYLIQHQESTRYIIEKIKTFVIGTPFRIHETQEGFEIRAGNP